MMILSSSIGGSSIYITDKCLFSFSLKTIFLLCMAYSILLLFFPFFFFFWKHLIQPNMSNITSKKEKRKKKERGAGATCYLMANIPRSKGIKKYKE